MPFYLYVPLFFVLSRPTQSTVKFFSIFLTDLSHQNPGFRYTNMSFVPVKEPYSPFLFQHTDLSADCWLGNKKILSCLRKAKILGHCKKNTDLITCHKSIPRCNKTIKKCKRSNLDIRPNSPSFDILYYYSLESNLFFILYNLLCNIFAQALFHLCKTTSLTNNYDNMSEIRFFFSKESCARMTDKKIRTQPMNSLRLIFS